MTFDARNSPYNLVDDEQATGGGGGGGGSTTGGSYRVYSVKDYSATGDGATDDTAFIRAAMAACSAAGGGIVYFPNGTYRVRYDAGAPYLCCLSIPANVTLRGESREGVVVKLMDNQPGFTRVWLVDHADDVVMENMTTDGNKAGQAVPEEHMAGFFAYGGSRMVIRDCTFQNCVGDGIDIFADCYDSLVENCLVTLNDRSGIAFNGGGQRRITIRSNKIYDNAVQQLDFEPPDGPLYDFVIDGNYLKCPIGTDYVVALEGQSEINLLVGCTFTNNLCEGCVLIRWCDDMKFTNNKCSTRDGDLEAALHVDGQVRRCYIAGNTFTAYHTFEYHNVLISGRGDTDCPSNLIFENNHIESPLGHQGISIEGTISVAVRGNRIINGTALAGVYGISVRSNFAAWPMHNVELRDNYVQDFSIGIAVLGISTPGATKIHDLICTGNHVRQVNFTTQGYDFNADASEPIEKATIYGNTTQDCYADVLNLPACPILIGGTRGHGGVYSVLGTPNGVITERVGAAAVRRDGGAGTTLYVKESVTVPGVPDTTGWVAK